MNYIKPLRITGFIIFVITICIPLVHGQYYEQFSPPVMKEGEQLTYPFTGGFEAPQFSAVDMNNDGLNDIYVFDKNGGVSSVFIRKATGNLDFEFTKYYNRFFPKSMEGFALMRDFNGDGLADLFCSSIPQGAAGLSLYQAEMLGNEYVYSLRRMGRPQGSADIIWNNLPYGQVYNAVTDIPAIVDVDHDGDLDILSFDEVGSYVYFNKNNQVEKGLPSDTMDFNIEDFCFGKFLESGLSQSITLSDNPELCATNLQDSYDPDQKSGPHSGSTVMAFDPDGDMDYDLLLGDLTYNGMVYLENGGSRQSAFMNFLDSNFPIYDTSIDMPIFLAGFNLDVDNDGFEDILIAPNALSSARNVNNIHFYRNKGSDKSPYTLESESLFSSETIDLGSLSVPALADYNADGLMDIVIAAAGPFEGVSNDMRLVLYENTGTRKAPQFELVDPDYLNFSQYSSSSSNPAACFGDLDQDQDMDLLIGDESGKLYFFENTAGPGNIFSFASPVYEWMGINSGQRIRPCIYDANKDGLNDILIGERNTNGYSDPLSGEFLTGNINYFENIGTAGNPLFDPDEAQSPNSPVFGRIRVNFSTSTSARGGAAPYIFNLDGKELLFVGSSRGRISLYDLSGMAEASEEVPLLDDKLGYLEEGYWSAPAVYDFDDDGFLEILVGNIRGGLSFFKTDLMHTSSIDAFDRSEHLFVVPNPAGQSIDIKGLNSEETCVLRFYDYSGRFVYSFEGYSKVPVDRLKKGMYAIEILGSSGIKRWARFVKI